MTSRTCCALWAVIVVATSQVPAVEIVAHRGASHDAPENTLASFRLGWEQRADANELDVYLTRDGQIVVLHDSDLKRTTTASGPVVEHTLAEVRNLDAGAWKGPAWKGERVPTLAEVLAMVPSGKRLFIEIKCGPEILPELERVLKASAVPAKQLVLISFKFPVVEQAKRLFPEIEVCWLASHQADKFTRRIPRVSELLARAKAAGLDGLDLDYKFPLDADVVQGVKQAGLKLYVWTVDDATVARELAAAGVDGITTNRPAWLREQLAADDKPAAAAN